MALRRSLARGHQRHPPPAARRFLCFSALAAARWRWVDEAFSPEYQLVKGTPQTQTWISCFSSPLAWTNGVVTLSLLSSIFIGLLKRHDPVCYWLVKSS